MFINAPGFGFDTYEQRNSEVFNRPPVSEALPTGPEHTLEQFMMITCTINKLTYEGNEQFLGELTHQLQLNTDEEKGRMG